MCVGLHHANDQHDRMNVELNATSIGFFALVVFPGLMSTAVYRLVMPARGIEWGNAVVQGVFYSTVNFVLGLPLLYLLVFGYDPLGHPVRYTAAAVLLLLVLPVVWPLLLVRIFKSKKLARKIQIPYPTAWDYLFDRREPLFLLVHLNSGALIGGYYGGNSYAGSFPNDGDIYIEAVYGVDEGGKFSGPIPDTRGVLLRKEQYSFIEFFSVPEAEDQANGEQERLERPALREGGVPSSERGVHPAGEERVHPPGNGQQSA